MHTWAHAHPPHNPNSLATCTDPARPDSRPHARSKSFDTNGDGFVSLEEFQQNLKPKTRKKIEQKLEGGWTFDAEAWAASVARHKRWNMSEVFAQFDHDGDGKLTLREFMRAFRAIGLEKRTGEKMAVDEAMFKSFDVGRTTRGLGAATQRLLPLLTPGSALADPVRPLSPVAPHGQTDQRRRICDARRVRGELAAQVSPSSTLALLLSVPSPSSLLVPLVAFS